MAVNTQLISATKKLKQAKIKNPHFEAEILLSFVLKKTREHILTYPNKKLSQKQIANFNSLVTRRCKGEPIAYLVSHKEFYGLKFKVNKNVLIPRPETELMIDEITQLIKKNQQPTIFVDIGTGSGCIIITLAKLLKNKRYSFLASDISKLALQIAKQNTKNHRLDKRIIFKQGNLLEPIIEIIDSRLQGNNKKKKTLTQKSKIIITANLPYGWKDWKNNCSMDTISLKFEPSIALFTEKNGLLLYEKFLKQIAKYKKTYTESISCFLEFDPRQTTQFKKLIKKYLPNADIKIKKDLSGHNRLAIISI